MARNDVLARAIQRSYLTLPESWRAALPKDLRGQVRDWLGLGGPQAKSRVPRPASRPAAKLGKKAPASPLADDSPPALERQLWSGFAAKARDELEALAGLLGQSPGGASKDQRSGAAWVLARWHAAG
ncbi:MAG TPA: hypothetical protein VM422_08650, partial [Amaricoccus sp.]|nr:hypothetical protein [Amaricoccus sp.]